jgi:calcineurin-like phosphoesterase family protein
MKKKNFKTFVCADLHFGHRKVVNSFRDDGVTKQRPWHTTEDHDTAIIRNWNMRVDPDDLVIVAGDLAINRHALQTIDRCSGRKILVKGNHDRYRLDEYSSSFEDIVSCYVVEGFIITHIPIHPMELTNSGGRWRGNIHGHLHDLRVMRPVYGADRHWEGEEIDPRYLCISMEQLNYAPIQLEEAFARFDAQQIV